VGYRDETDTISSVNKLNGHVEQHKLTRTIPIEGIIEKVKMMIILGAYFETGY